MSKWHCETCDKTIKTTSKKKHLLSKKHIEKENAQGQASEECPICIEPMVSESTCKKCKQGWCGSCDKNINKCPYCRASISGRERRAKNEERVNRNRYENLEVFIPSESPRNLQDPIEFLTEMVYHAVDQDWRMRAGGFRAEVRLAAQLGLTLLVSAFD
jgi:hypothetical protein